MSFDQPPEHHGPEQWEEDAIAYIYSQKMRRDDGEEIDDDDLVDAVFGEDRPARRATPSASGGEMGQGCATLLVVAVVVIFALLACWAVTRPY